jgi:hypothetical protein
VVVACAPAHPDGVPSGPGALVVVYKAELGAGGAVQGRAKLSVWAAQPDRLHAEILTPVGGVAFLLDAGGGRVCIVDVDAGIAYAGEDGPGAIESLIGVRVSVSAAVAALLHGTAPPALSVVRDGAEDGALPASFRITDGERFLSLSRVRVERGNADTRSLGTGTPASGLPLRPIERLAEDLAPRR